MTRENVRASARSIEECRSDVAETKGRWVRILVVMSGVATLAAFGCDSSDRKGDSATGQAGIDGAAGGVTGTGGGASGQGGQGQGGQGDGTGGLGGGPIACGAGSGSDLGVASHPDEGNSHVVVCSEVHYQTVPPSSGSHYPAWPIYKTYAEPVPWGYLVHGLEHGAVILFYNCPGGCPAEVAGAQKWIDSLPADDPLCPGEQPRVILVPDPTLDVRWAAAAWGWTLRWCTFDASMFQSFFTNHYNQTYEKICRSSGGADQSDTGWCL